MQIFWYDANGNFIATSDGNQISSSTGGWQTSSVTASAPPGATYARIGIFAFNNTDQALSVDTATWDYQPPAGANNPGTGLFVGSSGTIFTQPPTNPDFENGDSGWTKGEGWSIEQATNTSNGKWVAAYQGTGPQTLTNNNRVPVVPGQTISASAQISLDKPSGSHPSGAVLILWYDANGNFISASEGNIVSQGDRGNFHGSSVTGTAPPGAAFATVGVSANGDGSGATIADAVTWDYQYIPPVPSGIIQTTYVYDRDGNLASETDADGHTESWTHDSHGRVTQHTDLSGATYNYTYDAASGLQTGESDTWSAGAQNQSVPPYVTGPITTPNGSTTTYNANGSIASVTYTDGSSYSYGYDANGNQVRQESTTVDGNNKLVHTVTQTTFDSHNRISHVVVTDATTGTVALDETYTYDAAGNRREVAATSGGTTTQAWYTYDGDNRVQISNGALVSGNIVLTTDAASFMETYDGNGNVVVRGTKAANGDMELQTSIYDARSELIEASYAVDVTTGGASQGVEEVRTYDADGHVITINQFYALNTSLTTRSPNKSDPYDTSTEQDVVNDVGGDLSTATINRYDAVGRLAEEQDFGHASDWDGSDGDATIPTSLPDPNATTYGSLTLQNAVVYQGPGGTAGYDAMGNVAAYQYRDANGRIDQYQVTYLLKDTYLEATTSGTSNTQNVRPTTDESYYDTRGNRVAIAEHTQFAGGTVADTVRVFAFDGNNEIIERRDGSANGATLDQGTTAAHENQHYAYVEGQQIAHYDEGGTLDVLDQVTAFSNTDSGTSGYVVQAGDTLKSMAQALYGNANLWYVIAQANALSSDSDLSIGQDLTIPQVTTNSNDATTFKPYNPSEIAGSTTPSLPTIAPPPPPTSQHCNVLAAIIIIAVIVVATIVTAGAAALATGAVAEGSVFAAGTTVLAGGAGLTAAAVGSAFAGGVIGNANKGVRVIFRIK